MYCVKRNEQMPLFMEEQQFKSFCKITGVTLVTGPFFNLEWCRILKHTTLDKSERFVF